MKSCKIPGRKCIYSCFLSLFTQAYFRQGVALQYLGRHADALAAFASGLAQDPKSLQLLVGMVEAAMKSPLRGTTRASPPHLREDRRGRGNSDVTVFILFFYSVTSVGKCKNMQQIIQMSGGKRHVSCDEDRSERARRGAGKN